MHEIGKFTCINRTQLKEDAYLESLLQAAYEADAITEREIERIQLDCVQLLAEKTRKITSGSSTIGVDEAEMIMQSLLFIISLHLKSFSDPHDALKTILSESIPTLYALGQRRLKIKYAAVKHLYHKVVASMVRVQYYYYTTTVVKEFGNFFSLYTDHYTASAAHELPGDVMFVYPLIRAVQGYTGIELVWQYLKSLYYEHLFCQHFADDAIFNVMCRFNPNYEAVMFNICEQVLATAIGCVLAGANVRELRLNAGDYVKLKDVFTDVSVEESEKIIADAYVRLMDVLNDTNSSMQEYIKAALPKPVW